MKEALIEVCRCIENEARAIVTAINNETDLESQTFENPILITGIQNSSFSTLRGKKGIYIFLFNEAGEMSKDQVRDFNSIKGAGLKSSLPVEYCENDCLYLGSCISKSLFTRIKEHYSDNGTFSALKLNNQKRNWIVSNVRCYVIPLKTDFLEYRRILLPQIEKKLHEEFLPYAGSNRV